MKKIAIIMAIVVGLGGCAGKKLYDLTETTSQKFYATLATFEAVDAEATVLVQKPDTPDVIKKYMKLSRTAAIAALEVTQVAHDVWIDAKEAYEQLPPEATQSETDDAIAKVSAAFGAFVIHQDKAFAKVDDFKALVESYIDRFSKYDPGMLDNGFGWHPSMALA